MKNKIILVIMIIIMSGICSATELNLGLNYGFRTINDKYMNDNFGNGNMYDIYGTINIIRNFSLGIEYSGGFSKTAELGLNKDISKLKFSEIKVFGAYGLKLNKFVSILKAGLDFYSYEQHINSINKTIEGNKLGFFIGLGLKYYFMKNFFILAEANYNFIHISPANKSVNMGGLCLKSGIGVTFNL